VTPADRARALVKSLPSSIRVGPYDFRLVQWGSLESHADRYWGQCSLEELTIRISVESPSPVRVVDTLLHEISHAIWWVHGVEESDKQERVVSAFGTAWMGIYRDNPWLLSWLKRALHP
jgi:hypothetical protein